MASKPMTITEGKETYPKVSIGLPTYNSHGKLVDALDSIINQAYPNIEIIISDNCSTDDTQELCCKLAWKFPFIKYFRQNANIGLMPNFEFVLKQSSGAFFMWLADDDRLEPNVLKEYVRFLMNNSEYSLVSGRIVYWLGNHPFCCEKNFSLEMSSPSMRVFRYYLKVVYGGMYHGLMRRDLANKISMTNRIGDDWHFVAALAFQGRIKNLDQVGYNKKFGGLSKNFEQYARTVKATKFAASFPRVRIGVDAFLDIFFYSKVFEQLLPLPRFLLAASSCLGIISKYYCAEFPFVIGGRIKRLLLGGKVESKLEYLPRVKTNITTVTGTNPS
jgi:glycosyltransferase involved in cell wall biosynthesis